MKGKWGFIICWFALSLYSYYIVYIDWKIGILGIILSWLLGFLGFDMVMGNDVKGEQDEKEI